MRRITAATWILAIVALFGLALNLTCRPDVAAAWLAYGALLLFIFSMRAAINSLPVFQRIESRRKETERAATAATNRKQAQDELDRILVGWEPFRLAANDELSVSFYRLYDARNPTPEEWMALKGLAQNANVLARQLVEPYASEARHFLRPFVDREPNVIDAQRLRDWLSEMNRRIVMLRREAGLPPPPADPPLSTGGA